MRLPIHLLAVTSLFSISALSAEETASEGRQQEVFSGPQAGEKLTPFKVAGVFGDDAGKELDYVTAAAGKPIVVVFFHKRTRPAFGVTRGLMKYAVGRKDKLASAVVWLTDDATSTETWLKQVQRYFPKGMQTGISKDGAEGPGAYGLNRNVELTVIVGKDNKVTANFALVQPSAQADLPKILKAVTEVAGGEVPKLETLLRRPAARQKQKRKKAE